METEITHPCFSINAASKYARLHLPVAPDCNIKCAYCNRKFDCVNESRPGVTSSVLTPEEALERFIILQKNISDLKIVGIAGPGDALANSDKVFKTLRLIREYDKKIDFCISTNGVNLVKYLDEIKDIGIKYITVTVNSRKIEVARTLYKWAHDGQTFLKGANAAKFILEKQEEALDALKKLNIHLKINTVYIPGVNDFEIEDIVQFAKQKKANIINIMPFIPAQGTYFENFPMVSRITLNSIRQKMSNILPQMMHCQQCRADAVGKLIGEAPVFFDNNIVKEIPLCNEKDIISDKVLRFAVTSSNGYIVDQHFGHAKDLLIYDSFSSNIKFIERREIIKYCSSKDECLDPEVRMGIIKEKLADCHAFLVMRIGDIPRKILENNGLYVNMTYNRIEDAIRENYKIYLKSY
ncbi:radical SAM protein [Candidatus Poribacteria bacterium]|nr:radical SAM protein [Candidatus Poribacteria bacterium]